MVCGTPRSMASLRAKRAACPVLSAFENNVLPAYRGLARRLVDDTLRPDERRAFERTVGVLRLQERALSLRAIAVELHTTEDALKKFTGRGVFRTVAQFIREQAAAPDSRIQGTRQREQRRRWDEFAPDALDYFDAAFERDANGEYVDPNRAERAAFLVAKSQGWTEPPPPPVRRVELKAGIIQAQMLAIAECDARLKRPLVEVANDSPSRDE